jgi:hypothetical protein
LFGQVIKLQAMIRPVRKVWQRASFVRDINMEMRIVSFGKRPSLMKSDKVAGMSSQ